MGKQETETELTPKQRLFALEYLVDLNATQAAIRAGYSAKTAGQQGPRLLENVEIKAFIDKALQKREAKLELSADRVLAELMRVGFSDIGKVFDENGQLKPLNEIPEDVRRAIAGIEVDELFEGRGKERRQVGITRKIKLWNKVEALDKLARNLGLLKERVEITGKDGAPIEVTDARAILAGKIDEIAKRNQKPENTDAAPDQRLEAAPPEGTDPAGG